MSRAVRSSSLADFVSAQRVIIILGLVVLMAAPSCRAGQRRRERERARATAARQQEPRDVETLVEQDRQHRVGFQIVDIVVGGKPVAVAVWYPTDAAPKRVSYARGKVHGQAAENGNVKAGKWPLLAFSHGYSGGGVAHVAISEAMASRGWVVAVPDHSDEVSSIRIRGGSTGSTEKALRNLGNKPPSLITHGYRLREIRAVLDEMLSSKTFSIDPERVAFAGHSMGGWTVMNALKEEKRPKAVVLFSVGELNWYFKGEHYVSKSDLAAVSIPTIFLYGTIEKYAARKKGRDDANAAFCFENANTPSYLASIRGGRHSVYNDPEYADAGGTPEQMERIVSVTAAFLDRHVLGKQVRIPNVKSR